MANVEIYTTQICPYCMRAKMLLKHKGIEFTEIDVNRTPNAREEMTKRAKGGYTVPQIFINGEHIGGCDDMYMLEQLGELDDKLQAG